MIYHCVKSVGKYKTGNIINTENMNISDMGYIYRKVQEGAFVEGKAIQESSENKAIGEIVIENK